jgi:hypothetical protein
VARRRIRRSEALLFWGREHWPICRPWGRFAGSRAGVPFHENGRDFAERCLPVSSKTPAGSRSKKTTASNHAPRVSRRLADSENSRRESRSPRKCQPPVRTWTLRAALTFLRWTIFLGWGERGWKMSADIRSRRVVTRGSRSTRDPRVPGIGKFFFRDTNPRPSKFTPIAFGTATRAIKNTYLSEAAAPANWVVAREQAILVAGGGGCVRK